MRDGEFVLEMDVEHILVSICWHGKCSLFCT